jgi:hypothetical protein
MKKEAPKLKLIKGGKKEPKVKLNMELFFILGIALIYALVIIYGV